MNMFKNKKAKEIIENQQQAEIEIQQRLRQMKNKLVSESFVKGFLYCYNFLFEKHLKDYDKLSGEEKEQVKENIIREVIEGNNRYLNKSQK